MKKIFPLSFIILACLSGAAIAQRQQYIPFPPDFETLPDSEKEKVSKTVDENTEQYFRSPDYGAALSQFVKTQNPKGITECAKVKMSGNDNKINIVEPLLWEKADDRHPLVGKWEQTATFEGCGRLYSFTISVTANEASLPVMALKN